MEGGAVTISLQQSAIGDRRACRCRIALLSDWQLGAAVKLVRGMARDEHQRLGRPVRVEMPGPISTIARARHTDGDESKGNASMRWPPEHPQLGVHITP